MWLFLMLGIAAVAALSNTQSQVKLHQTFIPRSVADALLSAPDIANWRYETLYVGANGTEEYVCAVPHQEQAEAAEPAIQNEAELLERAAALIRADLENAPCIWAYELQGSYWTYALCGADKIIQYHEGAAPEERAKERRPENPSAVFVMGRFGPGSNAALLFDNQATPAQAERYFREAPRTYRLAQIKDSPFSHRPAQNVVVQMVTDGLMCDMTFQPRTVEVVYKCHSASSRRPRIILAEEVRTCHYRMNVHLPGLCTDEAFVPNKASKDLLVEVQCQRVAEEWDGFAQETEQPLHEQELADTGLLEASALADLFQRYLARSAVRSGFPVRGDNRISLSDYVTEACLGGFFHASRPTRDTSSYTAARDVLVVSGPYNVSDLGSRLHRLFSSLLNHEHGKRFAAPGSGVVSAQHTFVLWLEVYDLTGRMIAVARVENEAVRDELLQVEVFDPFTLLSESGRTIRSSFERPEYQAPDNKWNFEYYSEAGGEVPDYTRLHALPQEHVTVKKTTVTFYNSGQLPDGRINVQVVGEDGGEIAGHYNEDGQYVFDMEFVAGEKVSYVADVIPGLEYWGYPIFYTLEGEEAGDPEEAEAGGEGTGAGGAQTPSEEAEVTEEAEAAEAAEAKNLSAEEAAGTKAEDKQNIKHATQDLGAASHDEL